MFLGILHTVCDWDRLLLRRTWDLSNDWLDQSDFVRWVISCTSEQTCQVRSDKSHLNSASGLPFGPCLCCMMFAHSRRVCRSFVCIIPRTSSGTPNAFPLCRDRPVMAALKGGFNVPWGWFTVSNEDFPLAMTVAELPPQGSRGADDMGIIITDEVQDDPQFKVCAFSHRAFIFSCSRSGH